MPGSKGQSAGKDRWHRDRGYEVPVEFGRMAGGATTIMRNNDTQAFAGQLVARNTLIQALMGQIVPDRVAAVHEGRSQDTLDRIATGARGG